MILDKFVEIIINQGNKGFYKGEIGDVIKIPISKLTKGSHLEVNVMCDVCGTEYKIMYKQYNRGSKHGQYTCSSKCSKDKIKKSNLETFGTEYVFLNDEIKDKIDKTNIERYGYKNPMKNKDVVEKYAESRRKEIKEIDGDMIKYRDEVRRITRKHKKELLENWDGYDFYDGEYIKDNFSLPHHHKLYPTIDHKKSIFQCYNNGVSVKECANISNLCITTRSNNSKKGYS